LKFCFYTFVTICHSTFQKWISIMLLICPFSNRFLKFGWLNSITGAYCNNIFIILLTWQYFVTLLQMLVRTTRILYFLMINNQIRLSYFLTWLYFFSILNSFILNFMSRKFFHKLFKSRLQALYLIKFRIIKHSLINLIHAFYYIVIIKL
jgi:hypothetical protein